MLLVSIIVRHFILFDLKTGINFAPVTTYGRWLMLDDIDNLLADAINMHKAKDFNSAAIKYKKILERDADHADANYNFGLLTGELGLQEESLTLLNAALQKNPNEVRYWTAMIKTLVAFKRFDQAKSILKKAQLLGLKDQSLDALHHNLDKKFKVISETTNTLPAPNIIMDANSNASEHEQQKPSATNNPGITKSSIQKDQKNILDNLRLDQAVKLAKNWIKVGSYNKAERIFNDILQKFPKNRQAISGLKVVSKLEKSNKATPINPSQLQVQALINLCSDAQFKQALMEASKLLLEFPKSFIIYNVIGIANQGIGNFNEAVVAYEKAISFQPKNPDANYNLGIIYQEQSKSKKAEEEYKKCVDADPSYAEAYNNLGIILTDQGRYDEAIENYNKCISIAPDYAEAFNNLGMAFKDQGKAEDAIKVFRKAIAIRHDYVDAICNLGMVFQAQGELELAIELYKKGIGIEPNYAGAYNNMGLALTDQCKFDEAVDSINKAISIDPRNADSYYNLGNALFEKDKLDRAIVAFRKAVSIRPDFTKAWLNGANALERCNKIEQLELWMEEAVKKFKIVPADLRYFEAKSLFRSQKFDQANDMLDNIPLDQVSEGRQPFYFELKARCSEKLGDFDAAFNFFSDMNSLTKKRKAFEDCAPDSYFVKIKNSLKEIKESQKTNLKTRNKKSTDPNVTFLVGFPRSGTTLLDTILRSHSKIQVVEEQPMLMAVETFLKVKGFIDPQSETIPSKIIKEAQFVYRGELRKNISNANPEDTLVDKMPLNMLRAPLIQKIYPQAQIILALRHPLDAILSCWMQNFKLNPAMANMVELDRIVDFYCVAMETFDLCRNKFGLNVHQIKYENLVENFTEETSTLLQFMGLDWEDNMKNYRDTAMQRGRINTPSYSQVVQPIYKEASYRWLNYKKYLDQYLERLHPWISKFNYL